MIAYSEYTSDARIRREAESLAKRGDQIEVVCLPREKTAAAILLNGVRIRPLNLKRYRGSSGWRYVWSYLVFFCAAAVVVTFKHLLRRYDLIQVHTMPDFMVFAALIPRLLGARVLLDVHDLMPELYMSKFDLASDQLLIRAIAFMERASVAFAHRAIAVHQTHLEALVAHGNRQEHFEVLLNTPDPAIFRPGQLRNGNGGFKAVYHGTISRRHGLELALRAVAAARERIGRLRFSIIGDGDDLDRLIRLASELGLAESVEFSRRSVPVNELPDLLADADLGLVPLQRDRFTEYMLPVKVMEYVALGIPVIVTRTRTIEQYFDETMVGYISGDSVEELTRTIIDLYENPERRARMSLRADEFTRRYNWDRQKQQYFHLIDSLVGNGGR